MPLKIDEGTFFDVAVNMIASLVLFIFLFTGKGRRLERWEGISLLFLYFAYLTFLLG